MQSETQLTTPSAKFRPIRVMPDLIALTYVLLGIYTAGIMVEEGVGFDLHDVPTYRYDQESNL